MNVTRLLTASSLFGLALAGCNTDIETSASGSGSGDGDCQACEQAWTRDLGGDGWSSVLDVASDGDGNIVLLAKVSGEVPGLGLGPLNTARSFVAKLDPSGEVLWTKQLPEAAFARLALDAAGHVFLAGSSHDTTLDLGGGPLIEPVTNTTLVFLAELDGDGEHVWSRAVATGPYEDYSNTFIEPLDLTLGPDGTLVMTGDFAGPLDFGAGDLDFPENPLAAKVFVAAFDGGGQPLWSERFGTQLDTKSGFADTGMFISDTAVAEDGSVWLAGVVYGALQVGAGVFTPAGRSDGFLAKLDAAGHPIFTRLFGGGDQDGIGPIALGPGGTVLFGGFATGTVDLGKGPTEGDPLSPSAFVGSVDGSGALRWTTRLSPVEGLDTGYVMRLVVDSAGRITTLLADDGTTSASLLEIEGHTGGPLGFHTFAPTTSDSTEPRLTFTALALDPIGHLLVGGSLRGTVDLGAGPLASQPEFWGSSAFVGRLAR